MHVIDNWREPAFEAVSCPGGGDDHVAGARSQRGAVHLEASFARMENEYLGIGVAMQLWSVPRSIVDEEH